MRRSWIAAPVAALAVAGVVAGCGQTPGPATSGGTDVQGTVLAAPGCPVERLDSPCPPLHVAHAHVVAARDGRTVATATADASGRFELSLAAATYTITATSPDARRSTRSEQVTVSTGLPTSVTITLDSGIR
jgi:hypothetical protein